MTNLFRALCTTLALASIHSEASTLVSVSAPVGWSCGTGTGGFEAGCNPNVEQGTFGFTYDLSVADSDPDPTRGLFQGAITSFHMTVQQETRPDLQFTLAGANSITLGSPGGDLGFSLNLAAFDQSGSLGTATIRLNVYRVSYLMSHPDGLNHLPGASFWSGATAFVGNVSGAGYNVNETDWGVSFSANGAERRIPEPATGVLMLVGLAAVAFAPRRRKGITA